MDNCVVSFFQSMLPGAEWAGCLTSSQSSITDPSVPTNVDGEVGGYDLLGERDMLCRATSIKSLENSTVSLTISYPFIIEMLLAVFSCVVDRYFSDDRSIRALISDSLRRQVIEVHDESDTEA
jgi:hypothetical protein